MVHVANVVTLSVIFAFIVFSCELSFEQRIVAVACPYPFQVHTIFAVSNLCPFALISVCAVKISSHTEQRTPSVKPVFSQVGATAKIFSWVWSAFSVGCGSTKISPQTEHFLPSVLPSAKQVEATASIFSSVCSAFAVSVCAIKTSLHTEQCTPSVKPVF